MLVRVRLFASLREAVGRAELDLQIEEGATPEDVFQLLGREHPALVSRRPSLQAAVNRRYVGFDEPLAEGDEVVFVPPVSGGQGSSRYPAPLTVSRCFGSRGSGST